MSAHSLDLDKLAKLADLTLSDSEKAEFEPQLATVVNYFDELNEVNTDDTLPTSQTTGLTDILRSDEINVTRILPKPENSYFKVPKVIDYDAA